MLVRMIGASALALGLLLAQTGPPSTYSLEPGQEMTREIRAGATHSYEIRLAAGQLLRFWLKISGTDADVSIAGPDGVSVERRPATAGDTDAYPRVEFLAEKEGVYRILVHTDESGPLGRYRLHVEHLLSAAQARAHLATRDSWRAAAARWLATNAIPLRTVEAERGTDDLLPLRTLIGNARIVALGEATHGTREFFQLKHRLLEFLVTQMGFTAFAIEATMPECFDINHYVLTGEGDPVKALAGLYFWTWRTEEVLELIQWMRRYNADTNHRQKVSFYGMDMQFAVRARKVVLAYLRKVDAAAAADAEKSFGVLTNPLVEQLPLGLERQLATANAYQKRLWNILVENREEYQRKSSPQEWERVRQHLRVLLQNSDPADIRDRAMAENIGWILEQEGPQGKVVVWAHNMHVATQQDRMGACLRKRFGKDLVIFGFAFNRGGFQALKFDDEASVGQLFPFNVEPAPIGSLDAVLASAGHPVAVIPLRRLPRGGPVAEWIKTVPPTRSIGAGYLVASPSEAFYNTPVAAFYDALLFVEKTSPARALPGSNRQSVPVVPQPENPGFEAGNMGQVPTGWIAGPPQLFRAASQPAFDFQVTTTTEHPRTGAKCAEIRRTAGRHYGEIAGGLGQRIPAVPYQGKRIRLRAAVRVEVSGAGNQAHLWLVVNKGANIVFADAMLDRPITSGDWRDFEVSADIPVDAEFIDYGLALAGDGGAWLDDVSIEVSAGSR